MCGCDRAIDNPFPGRHVIRSRRRWIGQALSSMVRAALRWQPNWSVWGDTISVIQGRAVQAEPAYRTRTQMRHRPSLLDVDLSVLEKHLMPCLGLRDLFHLSLACRTLRERVKMLPNMSYQVWPTASQPLPADQLVAAFA